ncbi:hypothetical protein M0R45_006952 [Rubus argutus]|uniref:Uncharacterized protein n=1 Tax=Rubus argutus TaxID=59490 RepID=A0AAW1YSN9_RUBAR
MVMNLMLMMQPPLPPMNPLTYAAKFYQMVEESQTELYPGRGRSKLTFLVWLYRIKAMCGWTDVGLTMLLALLKEWFPDIQLSDTFYKTKKFITDLGLTCEKIDACPNDCMLFYKKTCPRLQHLYLSQHTAKSMIWHAKQRPKDDVLRHPADSMAWSKLDSSDPTFESEACNVHLGLASDGFNPFGTMSQSHSTWSVVMSVYNLPPWLCMKIPYLMLSLLIPGPTSPNNNIDVLPLTFG